ncbi:MAG: hypothetical protein NDI75_15340 [Candidatus Didemnitutus sp.]|nr:hypothetical protein [Candidatus Didemnitutus sp.]
MPETNIPSAPTLGSPAKRPHAAYTEAERRLISETYLRPEVQRNVAATVALLQAEHVNHDWDYQRVYRYIASIPALVAQHPSKDPAALVPDAADALGRPPILPPQELAEAKALVKQEALLKEQDWTALGLTEEQGKRMISMERFSQKPLMHMIRTTHGGMMFCLATLIRNFEDTAGRIEKCLLPSEVDGKGDPRPEIEVEREWHHLLLDYSREIRAIADQATRSKVLLLKAEQMAGEGNSGKKKGKPGFGPMLVKAEPGSTVNLHGNGR